MLVVVCFYKSVRFFEQFIILALKEESNIRCALVRAGVCLDYILEIILLGWVMSGGLCVEQTFRLLL